MKKYTIMQLTHEVAEVVRINVKLSRYRHVGAKEKRSSFLSSALDGGEWSASRPYRAFILGKGSPIPIVQEAGWASAGLDARG
jgi:hypothetical protein